MTFALTGAVTEVPSELSSVFSVGDPIVGFYTFDVDALDINDRNLNRGTYARSVSSFELTIGTYRVTSVGDGDIAVDNDVRGGIVVNYDAAIQDGYTVVALASGDPIPGINLALMALEFVDSTATAFSDDGLPFSPPNLSLFDSPNVTIHYSGADGFSQLVGSALTLQVVPEPSASFLICLTLLVSWRRKYRS